MTSTFYLKQPNSKTKSLIYFSCSFKNEKKKFVYSTGEKILPKHWSFPNNEPKKKGTVKDVNSVTIKTQIDRYSAKFEEVKSRCKDTNQKFTTELLRAKFNEEFQRVSKKKNDFFGSYDEFMTDRQKHKAWKPATVKRYKNIQNHLEAFEIIKKYKLTFSTITDEFYSEFLDYCYVTEKHFSNTVARNIGLFKTFMYWALDKKYTYNDDFKKFKTPKTVITEEVALSLEQVEDIFNIECDTKALEKVKDIFVFQCLTGLRYGEMKAINKNVVNGNEIFLKEEKDASKEYRKIPLFELSMYILKKYDYQLPLISNQKQNKYIKEILKEGEEFTNLTEFTRVRGVEITKFVEPLHERISTHTARRTFITIMRNKGIADKTIMSITGHKDLKTFNNYHKVDDNAKLKAVNEVFGSMKLPKLKKA